MRETGQIAKWDAERKIGLIRRDCDDEAPDLFLHITGLAGRWTPAAGDAVEFEVADTERGQRGVRVARLESQDAA